MLKEKNFKPIPKRIEKIIRDIDSQERLANNNRYYCYLDKYKGELVKVTVAAKKNKKKELLLKQVAIHGLDSERCFVNDMEYSYMGGYVVDWFAEKISTRQHSWGDHKWYDAPDYTYDPYAKIVNMDFISKFDDLKYSGFNNCPYDLLFKYLRLYRQYPKIEYLMKANLPYYAISKQIRDKCEKDKKFVRYLMENKEELAKHTHHIPTVLFGYREKISIKLAFEYYNMKTNFSHSSCFAHIKNIITNKNFIKFANYLKKQETEMFSYKDYFEACVFLGLDMTQDKNVYPHNFRYWHNIRIAEKEAKQRELNREKYKEFNKIFNRISKKYISMELKDNEYSTIIAKSKDDLIFEGDHLHHCVGKMNYDKKFVDEQSLIFFVRLNNNLDLPYVTLEYSLSDKRVIQCYGDRDSRPNENVLDYVNNTWLPYANKKLRKILKTA